MATGRGLAHLLLPAPACDPGVCTQMLTRACVVSMVHVWVWKSVCVWCVHVVRCLHSCVECVACLYVICVWGVFMCLSMCVFPCVWGVCARRSPALGAVAPSAAGLHGHWARAARAPRPSRQAPPSQSRSRKRKCPPSAHFRAAEAAGAAGEVRLRRAVAAARQGWSAPAVPFPGSGGCGRGQAAVRAAGGVPGASESRQEARVLDGADSASGPEEGGVADPSARAAAGRPAAAPGAPAPAQPRARKWGEETRRPSPGP